MCAARAGAAWSRSARTAGVITLLGLSGLGSSTADAGRISVAGVAGYEYYDGPQAQLTRGALGALVVGLSGFEATLAGVRYDDRFTGRGVSATAGLGVPLGSGVMLRGQGTRFVGDETYRAWRAKVGPQLNLPGGRTLLLWYSRYQDNQDLVSDGAIVETELPLAEKLNARLNGSYATAPQGVRSLQGAVGLGWRMLPQVELSGEVGLAQNGGASASAPSFPGLPLPFLDGGDAGQRGSANEVWPTALFGVRVSMP